MLGLLVTLLAGVVSDGLAWVMESHCFLTLKEPSLSAVAASLYLPPSGHGKATHWLPGAGTLQRGSPLFVLQGTFLKMAEDAQIWVFMLLV